jgi:hypothetical protein
MKNLEKDLLKGLKISVHMDKEFHNKLKMYCKDNGYAISQLIRVLLKKFMEGKIKL